MADEGRENLAAPMELPAVEGLNSADGLRRVAGNRKLYFNLLNQFVEGQSDAAERIQGALGTGELSVAERLAHTVKGVAGTIGAGLVQAAAGELEKAIREQAEAARIEDLRRGLGAALAALAASLKPFLASLAVEAAPDEKAAASDPAALRLVVERLAKLLAECDPDAVNCLEAEKSVLRILFAADAFSTFERLVVSYSFDEALIELRRAAAEQGA